MAPEKKNEFLDASDSEEDVGQGYDSEDDLRKGGRSAKRRKIDESDEEASDIEDGGVVIDDEEEPADDGDDKDDTPKDEKNKVAKAESDLPDVTRPLTKKNLVASEAAIRKSGVVYLSRIPPFMKPQKLRSLLEPYGNINRIFLAPEDPTAHARRVKAGGNKKKTYTEGWVEFIKKKDGKTAAELLNARTIGGKKGSYYHDDLWNLLYLKGFKWHNLTEQISSENAERTSRMRAEISKTHKENKDFVRNVERAKVQDGIQASKARKRKQPEQGTDEGAQATSSRPRSTFKQTSLVKKGRDGEEQPEHVSRVLNKIF